MNTYFTFFILLFCMNSALGGSINNYYLIDGLHEDNSVIKMWFTVLGLLDEYDNGLNDGFEITFNHDGRHYYPDCGPNWWEYYFTFNSVGSPVQNLKQRIPRYKRSTIRFNTACTMPAARGYYLLKKYMHLQPSLLLKIEQIKAQYWPADIPVVGIYYQNPIMAEVQPSWTPIDLCNRIKDELKDFGAARFILFTDLEDFAHEFMTSFDNECVRISALQNNALSTPAQRGEREFLTLLLLAQCAVVIAPGSYQSIGAKMLNPEMKLIELDTIPYALK